jgi:hypothetical protein
LIAKNGWQKLLEYDELNRELAAGRVLSSFKALQPNFPPTFKRLRDIALTGEDITNLNTGHPHPAMAYYNTKRLPSYTDRILYRSLPGFEYFISEGYFESCEYVTSSDHKPVRAFFLIDTVPGDKGIHLLADGKGTFELRLRDLEVRIS